MVIDAFWPSWLVVSLMINIFQGHNKPITAMDLSSDKKTIYTGGSDGTLTAWDPESGNNQRIGGSGHGAQIIQIKGTKTTKTNI